MSHDGHLFLQSYGKVLFKALLNDIKQNLQLGLLTKRLAALQYLLDRVYQRASNLSKRCRRVRPLGDKDLYDPLFQLIKFTFLREVLVKDHAQNLNYFFSY